jgi:ABC-2 type transport system permease protein
MIRMELRQLLTRPRTWVSMLLLVGLPVMIAIFVNVTGVAPRPGQGPALLSDVLNNGTLFAAAALAIVLPLFLPVAVLVIAGEAIAGEAQSGTLRYLLARPVGRTRLLVAKLISLVVFVIIAVILVAGFGYLIGTQLFGSQPLPSLSGGPPLTTQETTLRIIVSILYVAVSMLGVASIGLFLSTLTDAPLAATLGGLAALIISGVMDQLDAAAAIKPYLPTHYWLAFVDLFRNPVLWRGIERGVALQLVYVVVLLAASWAVFMTKDVTS